MTQRQQYASTTEYTSLSRRPAPLLAFLFGIGRPSCYNFLHGFKGAPSARQADRPRLRLARMRGTCTESVNELGSDATGSEGCWGLSPQVGGSLARSLLRGSAPVACRCRRADGPAPGRSTPRRNAPWVMRSASWPGRSSCAECASRRMKGHSTGPERRALSGLAPPASRALPPVASPRRWAQAPTLEHWSLCQPSGPLARARPKARPDRRAANLCLCQEAVDAERSTTSSGVQQQSAAARPVSVDPGSMRSTTRPAQTTLIDLVANSSHRGVSRPSMSYLSIKSRMRT